MATAGQEKYEEHFEQLGNLLRIGVITAALVVLAGGIVYLSRHGMERIDAPGSVANYRTFPGQPDALHDELRKPLGIVKAALALRGRGIIQFGLLLLIATPVARVLFSVIGFVRERDFTYVVLTLFVLAVLLYSLFEGHL